MSPDKVWSLPSSSNGGRTREVFNAGGLARMHCQRSYQVGVERVAAYVLVKLEAEFRGGMGYATATIKEIGRVLWFSKRKDIGVHIRLPSSALAASGIDPV